MLKRREESIGTVSIARGYNTSGRILHIVESLNRGAVETWLIRMLKHSRERNICANWDFYCALGKSGALDDEARSLGAQVIYSPVSIVKKWAFLRLLREQLLRGKYDVLHCHHDIVSGFYLLAALGRRIRRIVHVHNADEVVPTLNPFKACLYREVMRQFSLLVADRIVGISNHTLDTFLAGRTRRPERDSVHYYGVDPAPFENACGDRLAFRRQWGLADDSRILLFGGRIVPEKNPVFAVDVLASLRRMDPRVAAVFVGSGSQEQGLLRRARELGVESAVRLLGWRDDLAEIMSCSDLFILPHPEVPMEGFGLVIVEAQLAGLRMLISRGIPDDPLLPTASFRRLPLADGPNVWAKAAVELLCLPSPSRIAALTSMRESPMDMDRSLDELLKLYA